MRERAALRVLAGQPDRDALDQERRERERLGLAPVDPARVDRLAAALELLISFGCTVKPSGTREQLVVQLAQRPVGGPRSRRPPAPRARDPPVALAAPASRSTAAAARARPAGGFCSATSCCASSSDTTPPRRAAARTARARAGDRRSAAPSAAACTRARPARCGRGAGSRRDRSRRRSRSGAGTPSRAGSPRSPPRGRRR